MNAIIHAAIDGLLAGFSIYGVGRLCSDIAEGRRKNHWWFPGKSTADILREARTKHKDWRTQEVEFWSEAQQREYIQECKEFRADCLRLAKEATERKQNNGDKL